MDEVTAFFEQRAVETLGREPAQILLIHANRLNADHMPQLLGVYRRRGYKIVSLEEALRDPAYRLPDEFAGEQGISWLHHWSRTKGLPDKWEPDPPKWILDDPR